jgi:hypothetical protein
MTTNLIIGTNSFALEYCHTQGRCIISFMSHVRAAAPSDALNATPLKVTP